MKHNKLLSGLIALFLTASAVPYQGTAIHDGTKDASHRGADKLTLTAAAALQMYTLWLMFHLSLQLP